MYSFRIVVADYYLRPPVSNFDPTYSSFGCCAVTQVPVIRIFGITPTGEKACIHIHGVLPYIYVPCPGGLNGSCFMYQMANELDSALNKALEINYNKKHIFKISLVSGIPFYGYHSGAQDFVKIFFYQPYAIKKAVEILQSGTISNIKLQPHESHLPFILQFFIDYNLYGMSFLNLTECTFRKDRSDAVRLSKESSESFLVKESSCQIEVDAVAEKILNNKTILDRSYRNPGLAKIWEEEEERRKKMGLPPLLKEVSQERISSPTASDLRFREELLKYIQRRKAEETVSPEFDIESVASQEAFFREDHSSQQMTDIRPQLDEKDLKVLEILMSRFLEKDIPEEDSILGSQQEPDDSDSEYDLTQPLVTVEEEEEIDLFNGNETLESDQITKTEENHLASLLWPEIQGLSQIDGHSDFNKRKFKPNEFDLEILENNPSGINPFKPFYLDGSIDNDEPEIMKTPERKKIKIKPSPSRYSPLDVWISRSPTRSTSTEKTENELKELSPEMFRRFAERVLDFNRKIKSPLTSCCNEKSRSFISNCCLGKANLKENRSKLIMNNERFLRKRCKSFPIEVLKATRTVKESEPSSDDENASIKTEVFEYERTATKSKILSARKILFEEPSCFSASASSDKTSSVVDCHLKNGKPTTRIDIMSEEKDHLLQTQEINILLPGKEDIASNGNTDTNAISLEMSEETDSHVEGSDSQVLTDSQVTVFSFYDSALGILSNCTVSRLSNSAIYVPLADPPSRDDIFRKLTNSEYRTKEAIVPFIGNPSDSSSSKEIGVQIIRLCSKFPRDLEEFEGSFGSVMCQTQDRLLRYAFGVDVKNHLSIAAGTREIVIYSAKDPPTKAEAEEWCKNCKMKDIPNLLVGNLEEDLEMTEEMSLDCSQSESILLSQESLPTSQSTPLSSRALRLKLSKKRSRNLFRDSLPTIAEDIELIPEACHENDVVPRNRSSGISPVLESRSNSLTIDKTPDNSGAFKLEFQNLQNHQLSVYKYLTLFILEVHTESRGNLNPDPHYDSIQAVFYTITNDVPPGSYHVRQITGFIMVCPPEEHFRNIIENCELYRVSTECELFSKIIDLVTYHNPDIIAGYEIEMASWGYLIERGYALGLNLLPQLSRMYCQNLPSNASSLRDNNVDLKIPGRIILSVWRLMRHEVALLSYSFENMMYHVLHTRVPKFSYKTLSFWWNQNSLLYRNLTIEYYLTRVLGAEKLLDQLDLVGRTCELASLFGIQFYEVLSRGSQFRVESMMLRMAKPMNYIPVSPSVQQRTQMRAPECLPLIMEPESRFYSDPVIVLDFQSLYPSMMIAYNYCFSTCLGRVESLSSKEEFKFGCTNLKVSLKDLVKTEGHVHVSPAGVAFVDQSIRRGIVPRMLEEILETRLMVKQAMKNHSGDMLLQKILDARQLGLKLIANVTYGYTSASFSGRMPCVEVGDSVVSKGRETLERAIRMVESNGSWGARVVYGDTDSLFVLCPGKSRKEAFIIGREIADAVTLDNPKPVKLKLEKVYQPCILQTKKRYVGYMYESAEQINPTYDAKGIETVRRDGCPASSKILEKSLKILFETQDMSEVKTYVCRQLSKVLSGRLSIQELTFSREYRGMSGYQPGACVPALKIAKERLTRDHRSEPRRSERVGYIITAGPPSTPLIRLARSVEDFLADPTLHINGDYYGRKAILPPLDRCLSLIGVDVFSWYTSLPRKHLIRACDFNNGLRKATIAQYFATVNCIICSRLTTEGVCKTCQRHPQKLAAFFFRKISNLERKEYKFRKICESCCGRTYETGVCESLICPVYYRRLQAVRDNQQSSQLRNIVNDFISEEF